MTLGLQGERLGVSRRSLWAVLSLASLLAGCAGSGLGSHSSATSHALVGAAAPAFELSEVGGSGAQSLASHAGQVVVVDFWATWCEPCRQSFPAYQKLSKKVSGLVIIGISQDDDAKGIPAFRTETGATFPIVWDDGKGVAKAYDPPTMPTAFVIDKSGIVRYVHVGYRPGDEATLEDEVRTLLR